MERSWTRCAVSRPHGWRRHAAGSLVSALLLAAVCACEPEEEEPPGTLVFVNHTPEDLLVDSDDFQLVVSPGDSSSAETTRDCLATDYHLMGASGADDSAVVCADGGRCTVDVYLEDGDLVVEGCQIEITTEL